MASAAFFNYTVPDGLVSIVRGFRYELNPIYISENLGVAVLNSDVTGKLTIGGPASGAVGIVTSNGADVAGFERFQLGQYVADYHPCYVIVGPLQTISLILKFTGTLDIAILAVGIGGTSINVEFYGNNLLATGRPINYEPGFSDPLPVYDKTDDQDRKERALYAGNKSLSMPITVTALPTLGRSATVVAQSSNFRAPTDRLLTPGKFRSPTQNPVKVRYKQRRGW